MNAFLKCQQNRPSRQKLLTRPADDFDAVIGRKLADVLLFWHLAVLSEFGVGWVVGVLAVGVASVLGGAHVAADPLST